ncbi:MAG: hypothetical protein DSY96_00230 [SAR324 cluster bacterium]|uniref:Uncharacterized protein n=1 Tax=SAR324 cluster bacterium TaxID=2024889 RepID=A0A432G3W9_9DELT|nr:MAG: hypothetical protein DSY97_07955 [SAR324 cluster bacterium]RTZ87931.1 MAG: hypothetical protein DSY96_00230 [SAR324 cluster bacterium]
MKKGIPVKQHGATRIPSPLQLSSNSKHEEFHFDNDDARILHDATECSTGNVKKQISFEQSEPHTSCFFDISKVWAVIL